MACNTVSAESSNCTQNQINPYAYAMEHMSQSMWKHHSSRQHSRATSQANTPAPSKPGSVHEQDSTDAALNPYAYAMEHMSQSIWKHAPSRNASHTPSTQEINDSSKLQVPQQNKDEVNPYAYAMRHSWLWKHSPL